MALRDEHFTRGFKNRSIFLEIGRLDRSEFCNPADFHRIRHASFWSPRCPSRVATLTLARHHLLPSPPPCRCRSEPPAQPARLAGMAAVGVSLLAGVASWGSRLPVRVIKLGTSASGGGAGWRAEGLGSHPSSVKVAVGRRWVVCGRIWHSSRR
jgi:hypothetical protein